MNNNLFKREKNNDEKGYRVNKQSQHSYSENYNKQQRNVQLNQINQQKINFSAGNNINSSVLSHYSKKNMNEQRYFEYRSDFLLPTNLVYPSFENEKVIVNTDKIGGESESLDIKGKKLKYDYYNRALIDEPIFDKSTIDEILAQRTDVEGKKWYLVKLSFTSYLHLIWMDERDIFSYSGGEEVFKKYLSYGLIRSREPFFNNEFIIPEFVLAASDGNNRPLCLVKWKGLGLKYCSWEEINNESLEMLFQEYVKRVQTRDTENRKYNHLHNIPNGWKQFVDDFFRLLYKNKFVGLYSNIRSDLYSSISYIISRFRKSRGLFLPSIYITINSLLNIVANSIKIFNKSISTIILLDNSDDVDFFCKHLNSGNKLIFDIVIMTESTFEKVYDVFCDNHWVFAFYDGMVNKPSSKFENVEYHVFITNKEDSTLILETYSSLFDEILVSCPMTDYQRKNYEIFLLKNAKFFYDISLSKNFWNEMNSLNNTPFKMDKNKVAYLLRESSSEENNNENFPCDFFNTGKLKFLLQIILNFIDKGERVLILCSDYIYVDVLVAFFQFSPFPAQMLKTKEQFVSKIIIHCILDDIDWFRCSPSAVVCFDLVQDVFSYCKSDPSVKIPFFRLISYESSEEIELFTKSQDTILSYSKNFYLRPYRDIVNKIQAFDSILNYTDTINNKDFDFLKLESGEISFDPNPRLIPFHEEGKNFVVLSDDFTFEDISKNVKDFEKSEEQLISSTTQGNSQESKLPPPENTRVESDEIHNHDDSTSSVLNNLAVPKDITVNNKLDDGNAAIPKRVRPHKTQFTRQKQEQNVPEKESQEKLQRKSQSKKKPKYEISESNSSYSDFFSDNYSLDSIIAQVKESSNKRGLNRQVNTRESSKGKLDPSLEFWNSEAKIAPKCKKKVNENSPPTVSDLKSNTGRKTTPSKKVDRVTESTRMQTRDWRKSLIKDQYSSSQEEEISIPSTKRRSTTGKYIIRSSSSDTQYDEDDETPIKRTSQKSKRKRSITSKDLSSEDEIYRASTLKKVTKNATERSYSENGSKKQATKKRSKTLDDDGEYHGDPKVLVTERRISSRAAKKLSIENNHRTERAEYEYGEQDHQKDSNKNRKRFRRLSDNPGTSAEIKKNISAVFEVMSEKVIEENHKTRIKRRIRSKVLKNDRKKVEGKIERPENKLILTREQEKELTEPPSRRRRRICGNALALGTSNGITACTETASEQFKMHEGEANTSGMVDGNDNLMKNDEFVITPFYLEIPRDLTPKKEDQLYHWTDDDYYTLRRHLTKTAWGRWETIANNMTAVVSPGALKINSFLYIEQLIKYANENQIECKSPFILGTLATLDKTWPSSYRKKTISAIRTFINNLRKSDIKSDLTKIETLMFVSHMISISKSIPSDVVVYQPEKNVNLPSSEWSIKDDQLLLSMVWVSGIPTLQYKFQDVYGWGPQDPSIESLKTRIDQLYQRMVPHVPTIPIPDNAKFHYSFLGDVFGYSNNMELPYEDQLKVGNMLDQYGIITAREMEYLSDLSSNSIKIYNNMIKHLEEALLNESYSSIHKLLPAHSPQICKDRIIKSIKLIARINSQLSEPQNLFQEQRGFIEAVNNYGLANAIYSPMVHLYCDEHFVNQAVVRKNLIKSLNFSDKNQTSQYDCTEDLAYDLDCPVDYCAYTIRSLGKFCGKPGYRTNCRIYPVGYICEILFPAYNKKIIPERDTYTCKVLEGKDGPIFRVQVSSNREIFDGSTPSDAWASIIDLILKNNPKSFAVTREIPGHELFGFDVPSIIRFIQLLPGARDLKNYEYRICKTRIANIVDTLAKRNSVSNGAKTAKNTINEETDPEPEPIKVKKQEKTETIKKKPDKVEFLNFKFNTKVINAQKSGNSLELSIPALLQHLPSGMNDCSGDKLANLLSGINPLLIELDNDTNIR